MQLAGRLLLLHCAFIASTENQQKIIQRRAHIRYGSEEVDGKWEATGGSVAGPGRVGSGVQCNSSGTQSIAVRPDAGCRSL